MICTYEELKYKGKQYQQSNFLQKTSTEKCPTNIWTPENSQKYYDIPNAKYIPTCKATSNVKTYLKNMCSSHISYHSKQITGDDAIQ